MRLRERFYLASLLWAALVILPAPVTWAAEDDLDGKARALDSGVPTGERMAFFSRFGIPNSSPYNTLPPGQALLLHSLCQKLCTAPGVVPAITANSLLSERQGGKGWGEIAKDHHVKLGPLVKAVTDAHRDLAAKHEKPEKPEKPEKLEKMQRMDRPDHPGRAGR